MDAKPATITSGAHESVEKAIGEIRAHCDQCITFCTGTHELKDFYSIEADLKKHVFYFGCLFLKLYLLVAQQRLNYTKWLESGLYYLKSKPSGRTIKTFFGEVRYWRNYLVRKGEHGGGFFPLDIALGLTRDGFSPLVIKLVTKLATRMSFGSSVLLFKCFCSWTPSSEAIEHLVIGLGRQASAYMEVAHCVEDDGEVLIIECDGKATPTATEEELSKRRKKRKCKKKGCNCQRHRGQAKRKGRKRPRRKKGDKSKNGRSTTIIVMYTLKRGPDGLLHGPINKKVWASYAPRKVMFAWARRQATRRGFPPDTDKRIHIAVDGERCLKDGLAELFPEATFTLDIRHVEEKIWKIGRAFYKEGSKELESWVETKRTFLYEGCASDLVSDLKDMKNKLSSRAKRDKHKREILKEVINYMDRRLDMMNYKNYIEEDLPVASGIVEGAARYVVGERMDCSGMRWIPGRAEALLHLRCIELNEDWDKFFGWVYERWKVKLRGNEKVIIRSNKPIDLTSYSTSAIPYGV